MEEYSKKKTKSTAKPKGVFPDYGRIHRLYFLRFEESVKKWDEVEKELSINRISQYAC